MLHLFAGSRHLDSSFLAQGWRVDSVHIQLSPDAATSPFNLLRKANQNYYLRRILDGHYDYVHLGPPCSSFSVARTPPIRTSSFIHGLPQLSPKDKQKVKEGNSLCYYCCRCLEAARSVGIPASLEQPWSSHMWRMPCMKRVQQRREATRRRTDFCFWGTAWQKRTGLLFIHVDPNELAGTCPGCESHVVLRGQGPGGVPWTRIAQPYPFRLCRRWAKVINSFCRAVVGDCLPACPGSTTCKDLGCDTWLPWRRARFHCAVSLLPFLWHARASSPYWRTWSHAARRDKAHRHHAY